MLVDTGLTHCSCVWFTWSEWASILGKLTCLTWWLWTGNRECFDLCQQNRDNEMILYSNCIYKCQISVNHGEPCRCKAPPSHFSDMFQRIKALNMVWIKYWLSSSTPKALCMNHHTLSLTYYNLCQVSECRMLWGVRLIFHTAWSLKGYLTNKHIMSC